MIFASQFAFNSPTENESEYSSGCHPKAEHVISVIPHPCLTLILFSGHSFSNSTQTSRPNGAAPLLTCSTEERSNFLVIGCLAMATTTGGTRIRNVMRYFCVYSSIWIKSNLDIT